jgi:hypothetical protein
MLGTKHKYLLVLYDEEGNWQDFEKFMDKFSDPVPCKRGSKRAARPPIISEVFGTRVCGTSPYMHGACSRCMGAHKLACA